MTISIERLNLILAAASGCRGCLVDDAFGIRTGDEIEPLTVGELHDICSLAMIELAEDKSLSPEARPTKPFDEAARKIIVKYAHGNMSDEWLYDELVAWANGSPPLE